jgi:predicted SAM-dependent methyltransferase
MPSAGAYVQFGCGLSAPEGWRNFDASPTLRIERLPLIGRMYRRNAVRFPQGVEFGDICKGLPVPTGSCAGVYASHVLEHLSFNDFHLALDETFRILRAGGIFRIIVPDLYAVARAYVSGHENRETGASHEFMRASHLGLASRPRGIGRVLRAAFGNSAHLWMWDELSLAEALGEHGFAHVRRFEFGDSKDPAFLKVEEVSRFYRACAMQAVKPGAM